MEKTYVAKAVGIIDKSDRPGDEKLSDILGIFLIKPIISKPFFGKKRITGFCEIISGTKVIDRFYNNECCEEQPINFDIKVSDIEKILDGIFLTNILQTK